VFSPQSATAPSIVNRFDFGEANDPRIGNSLTRFCLGRFAKVLLASEESLGHLPIVGIRFWDYAIYFDLDFGHNEKLLCWKHKINT